MSSIRRRITAGTLLAVSGFLAINGVLLYLVVRDRLMLERDRNLTVLARSSAAAAYQQFGPDVGREPAAPRRYALEGIAYSPWTEGQDPNEGAVVTSQRIWDDLNLLRDDAAMVRTYAVSSGLEDAGWLLHQLGKQAVIGAWIDDDAASNRDELDTLVALCLAGDVDVAVVGSEVLQRGDLPAEDLLALLREARERIPDEVPVTTADTPNSFLEHPELVGALDLVYVNYHPYWAGVPIESAVPTLAAWHDSMLRYASGKPVVVSEAGWPSDGDAVGAAEPTPENAARFFLEFVSWARDNDVRYTYFATFDEPWKIAYEGPQGAHWGYRDSEGRLKPGMQAVFDGLTAPGPEPGLELLRVPAEGSDEDLVGVAVGVGTLTHRICVLHRVGGVWYSKPSFATPVVAIASDGRFVADITTGPGDEDGTRVAVFLVSKDFVPPPVDGLAEIPAQYAGAALATAEVAR